MSVAPTMPAVDNVIVYLEIVGRFKFYVIGFIATIKKNILCKYFHVNKYYIIPPND